MQGFWKPAATAHSEQLVRDDAGGNEEGTSSGRPFNFSRAPLAQQRMLLPIYKHKRQILYAMETFGFLVIVGETGSGKSTQIPQYLYENGWANNDFQIVCTQPRRIAAQTLARRVADEVGKDEMGGTAGYSVRFDDCTSVNTKIKFVTDGILLREATLHDPLLSSYSAIMVDEAHERGLNSDALLGLLKKIKRKRADLRIIICSATIDAEKFLDFFVGSRESRKAQLEHGPSKKRRRRWDQSAEEAQQDQQEVEIEKKKDMMNNGTIISVDGRQHAVDILYVAEPAPDYIKKTVETVIQIHWEEPNAGDILCFLPSGEDIDRAIRIAEETLDQHMYSSNNAHHQAKQQLDLLPLYGTLPYQMQARVFQTDERTAKRRMARRAIFATNIAETSVTVPRITHVIDCGLAKLPYFDPKTGFDRLIVVPTSHASARQRAGRAGRIQSGKCFRLYTEKYMMNNMEASTPPEILRTNLTGFILTLKALGVENILAFDLLDLPSVDAMSHGLECLYALGAIDDKTHLTKIGMDMSAFPTEPRVSRMLLESLEMGCSWEVLGVASAMQVRQLFVRPRGGGSNQQRMLDYEAAMSEIADPSGDHVTYANILAEQGGSASGAIRVDEEECKEKFINAVALRRALEARNQLSRFLKRYGKIRAIGLVASSGQFGGGGALERSKAIRRCVTAGFFFNVAKLANDGRYYTIRKNILVTPSQSSVFHTHGTSSEYLIFCETSDAPRGGIELRSVSTIDAKWLRELAPHYWD